MRHSTKETSKVERRKSMLPAKSLNQETIEQMVKLTFIVCLFTIFHFLCNVWKDVSSPRDSLDL